MRDSHQSAEKAGEPPSREGLRADAARVLVLGLNAWLVLLLVPMLLAQPRGAGHVAWLLTPLVPLAAGIAAMGRSRVVAAWLLLGAYPTLAAGLVAGMPQLVVQSAYSTVGLLLGALSLVAYGAGAIFGTSRPARLRAAVRRPLGSVVPIDEPPRQAWMRRALLAVTSSGAVLLAAVAPSVGGVGAYEEGFGRAAPEAAILTTVVGGSLAAVTLAIFVGPALRAPRGRAPGERQVRRRVLALLLSGALGVAFFVFYLTKR